MSCQIGDLTAEWVQGDNVRLGIQARHADGEVIDLTGQSIVWQLKGTYGNVVVERSSTVLGEIEVPEPQSGLFYVNLPSSITETLSGKYTQAGQLTSDDNKITTLSNPDLSPGTVWVQKSLIT